MSKKQSKKKSKKKESILKLRNTEVSSSRTGGQIALSGFSYQMLYSCYLILSKIDVLTHFHLEGIEDIDTISFKNEEQNILYTQIKYSTVKQDASFMKPVLKNMLEVYLLDKNSKFKLVYDFDVAKGNMSKLFSSSLDDSSQLYWKHIIQDIKEENISWQWSDFEYINFLNAISFENVKRNTLETEIEKALINKYDITTDNITLFANGMKIFSLGKMSRRGLVDNQQVDNLIQSIKDDIAKGIQNPAHNWIQRVKFNYETNEDISYFEGKKASPQDIVNELPVRRKKLEQEIKQSLCDNKVTVIKASSGQGKTTLALQTIYDLRNEYAIYQISWCNDAKELNCIITYFETRIKLGEKILILIDNLDSQLSEWNRLAQIMQERVLHHYKILITTREDDWYNYAGNVSNVKSLNVIKVLLEEQDAQEIYLKLRKNNQIHDNIYDWKKAWNAVQGQQLLIEYVYLLTHGKMLSDRISEQITQISKTDTGRVKCEILRLISFADICGIRLSIKKLSTQLMEDTRYDLGEVLKSMEHEFMIRIDDFEKYIEGLHPVRSHHIVDRLHEFVDINSTAIGVVKISDENYLAKLFSNFPQLIINKEIFYSQVVELLWSRGLSVFIPILQGVFSGNVMEYYHQNKSYFDDANDHGGIFLVATESCPFVNFKEFDYKLEVLSHLKLTTSNSNVEHLVEITDSMSNIILSKTDIFILSKIICTQISKHKMCEFCKQLDSFAIIADWLINIDENLNLSKMIDLSELWGNVNDYKLESMSKIMYLCFCGNRDVFLSFVNDNLPMILTYLKEWTESLELYVSDDMKTIQVKYILLPSEIKKGNEESVNRIKVICRTLPIFETYCADAIMPKMDILTNYNIPDDTHKAMPIRNIFIMFHQEFVGIWKDTIMSNYEFDSIKEWMEFWFNVRKDIILLSERCSLFMIKLLEMKSATNLGGEIDELRSKLNITLSRNNGFPRENRPFIQEKVLRPDNFSDVQKYLNDISHFLYQIAGIIKKNKHSAHLPIINLSSALSGLKKMQICFSKMTNEHDILEKEHQLLCVDEDNKLANLQMTCMYYLQHMPNKYFNKNDIKKWYDKDFLENIDEVKNSLVELDGKHDTIYPQEVVYEGILSYYPIIVSNIDLTNGEELIHFIYKCAPFAEYNFDYLIVAIKDNNGEIIEQSLRITKKCLSDLKNAVDNEDLEILQKWTPPFPEIISENILKCFHMEFRLKNSKITGYENLDIIAELLWGYSKSRLILNEENNLKYRDKLLSIYETNIFNRLESYKLKIAKNVYDKLVTLCKNIIAGEVFGDREYNEFILFLLEIAKNNMD